MTDNKEAITFDQLKQAAQDFDEGKSATAEVKTEPVVDDPEPAESAPVDDAKAEKAEKEPVVDSKASTEEVKPKSKYAQNEERKSKTWQEINAEKAAIKAEREAIARERQDAQRRIEDSRQAAQDNEPARDEHGISAKEYAAQAKIFRKNGEEESAKACDQLASNIEQKHQKAVAQREADSLNSAWNRTIEDSAVKYPELKDTNSEFHKTVKAVLDEMPSLRGVKNGLAQAIRAAEIITQSRSMDSTKSELAKLKSEYEKLTKKTSIAGGPPTGAPEEDKPFDRLSLADKRKHLERAARDKDRADYGD